MTVVAGNEAFARDPGTTLEQSRLAHIRRKLEKLFRRRSRWGIGYEPNNRMAAERLAAQMIKAGGPPLGTVARSRFILDILQETFPTDMLVSAYFENLDLMFRQEPVRRVPGKVVIGLGTGRSGSTSLAQILSTMEDSRSTHENPPLISWTPEPEEVRFHIRRFGRLSAHFAVIADVSHWWLNAIDNVFDHFPDGKAIGVFRNPDACVRSFMKIKGSGHGSCNHWVPHDNGIWAPARWDSTYPTYGVPPHAWRNPDEAKVELISRYVREYNFSMTSLAKRFPNNVVLVKTEDLNDPFTQKLIFDFVGARGKFRKVRHNAGTTGDGKAFRRRHLI